MNKVILTSPDELDFLIQSSVRKVLSEQTPNKGLPQNLLFTLDQACEFLSLAKQTIYTFTSKREIPFIKRGKKLYFRKEDLENWLNEGKKPTVKEIQSEPLQSKKSK